MDKRITAKQGRYAEIVGLVNAAGDEHHDAMHRMNARIAELEAQLAEEPEQPEQPEPSGWLDVPDIKVGLYHNPVGESFSYRTGNHLLLRCGEEYTITDNRIRRGGTPEQPLVIRAVGDGPRPIVHCHNRDAMQIQGGGGTDDDVSHVFVDGIEFRAHGHCQYGFRWLRKKGTNVTLQDVVFDGFEQEICLQGESGGTLRNFTAHRCIVKNARGPGRPQGIYAANVAALYIVECAFDRCGMETCEGVLHTAYGLQHNHAVYLAASVIDPLLRDNLLSHAGSNGFQLRGGGRVYSNLILDCPIGGHVSRHESFIGSNVVLGGANGTDFLRGRGLQVNPCIDATVQNNIVAFLKGSGHAPFAYGVQESNANPATRRAEFNHNIAHEFGEDFKNDWDGGTVIYDPGDEGFTAPDADPLDHDAVIAEAVNRGYREWSNTVANAIRTTRDALGVE